MVRLVVFLFAVFLAFSAHGATLSDGRHHCLSEEEGSYSLWDSKRDVTVSFKTALKNAKRKVRRMRRKLKAMRKNGGSVSTRRKRRIKARLTQAKGHLLEVKQCRAGSFHDDDDQEDPESEEEQTEEEGSEEEVPEEEGSEEEEGNEGSEESSPGDGGSSGTTGPGIPSDLSAGPVPTTATYYVCDCRTGADTDCVAGSDSNSGTSANAPWQTYERARQQFGSLNAGEIIGFCQGGSFSPSGSTSWVNTNCRADNPCIVQNYNPPWASGDESIPLLSNSAGGIFDLSNGGDSQHEEGYTFRSLDLEGSNVGVGVFIFNDVDDLRLEYLRISGFQIGVQIAGANPNLLPGSDGKSKRITLYGSRIVNNSGQGYLGGCDNCVVEANLFDNNGFEGPTFYHNLYWADPGGNGVESGIIRNNELYRSTLQSGSCSGASFVVHGLQNDLLVEGNYVHEDAGTAASNCWGITVDSAYTDVEGFRRLIIRGNRVENMGNLAIGCTSCSDAVIENNLVIQNSGNVTAIAVPNRARGAEDEITTRVTVRNNTVYVEGGGGGTAISVGTEGTGHSVVSNAIYYAGTSSSWSCFDLALATSSYSAVDNNLCYFPNSSGEWESGSGGLTAWSGSSGFDTASLEEDPAFEDASNNLFEPASTSSPLVDAGSVSSSATIDITGQNRTTPDIGAYEY